MRRGTKTGMRGGGGGPCRPTCESGRLRDLSSMYAAVLWSYRSSWKRRRRRHNRLLCQPPRLRPPASACHPFTVSRTLRDLSTSGRQKPTVSKRLWRSSSSY